MSGRLEAVLAVAFPDREVDRLRETGPSWNEANETVRVEFVGGESCYLKTARDGEGARIASERAALEYVAENGEVPVPASVACDPYGAVPYLVTEPVAGRSLLAAWSEAGSEERVALSRSVGSTLAAVHTHRFESHGRLLGGSGGELDLRTGTWTDVLIETIGEARRLAPDDRFSHHFEAVIDAVEANRKPLDRAPAALLHGDPARPNCFLVGSEVGLLDWELVHVGDPARDLYRVRDQQIDPLRSTGPDELVEALHEGYRERAGGLPAGFEKRRPVYEAVRFLGVSGYIDRVAEFEGEPVEELAGWADEEMSRRLDRLY